MNISPELNMLSMSGILGDCWCICDRHRHSLHYNYTNDGKNEAEILRINDTTAARDGVCYV